MNLNSETLILTPESEQEFNRQKNSMNIKEAPGMWLGVVSAISIFGLTTGFSWALNIQEKVLSQDARLKVLEATSLEIRSDIKDIKDNVFFLRVNATVAPADNGNGNSNSNRNGRTK